jgi:hypothetical protein
MDKEPPSYEEVSKQGSSATISQTLSSSSAHQHYTPITNPYFTHTGNGNYSYTPAQNTLYPPQLAMGFHLNSSSVDPQLLQLQESWRNQKDVCRPLRYMVMVIGALGILGGIGGGIAMIVLSPTHRFQPAAQFTDYAIVAQFAKVSLISQFSYFSIASQISICSVFSMFSVCSFASMGALLSFYSMFTVFSIYFSCLSCWEPKQDDEVL